MSWLSQGLRTVSKWIPNEVAKAIPKEFVKAVPKELAPVMIAAAPFMGPIGLVSAGVGLNLMKANSLAAADADAQAKAASDAQAQKLYDIQHPNIVGQVTLGGPVTATAPDTTASQAVGPMSTSDGSPTNFSAPTSMTKAVKNAPVYNKPGGGGAALAQQAQDQSNFRLPSISGLTFGGS